MGTGNGLAPEAEKAVVRWVGGTLVHGGPQVDLRSDVEVRVSRDLVGMGVVSAFMLVRLSPLRMLVERLDGRSVEVQTFRYRCAAGDERYLCFCATCGDLMVGDLDDLKDAVHLGCRKCGIEVAAVGVDGPCPEWHTFGSCLRCPAPVAPPMPDGPRGNAGPQSGPAPHAGPAATEQGPGSSSCSAPSPLGGCGCGKCGS